MSEEELTRNLGTIAKSGSKEFLENLSGGKGGTDAASNIIGKFGVGFYSAFMVGKKVEVHTSNGKESFVWAGRYGKFTVSKSIEAPKPRGTKIVIHMKEEDCKTIASQWAIEETLKKYSAFVSELFILTRTNIAVTLLDEETFRGIGRASDGVL